MRKNLRWFLTGAVVASIFSSGVVFASDISKTVDVVYNNIKIFIDGGEYIAKDANGNVVEPFIYNGTTYLPVRGVANAFGKDVVWDGANASIYLGKKEQNQPDNWLDRIQYSYYAEGRSENNLHKINGKITDFVKNDYTNGMLFYSYSDGGIKDDKDNADILIDYPLNGQYKSLTGKIVLPQKIQIAGLKLDNENTRDNTTDVLFFVDDRLVHTATQVTKTMPFTFNIDVKGANKLTIKMRTNGYYIYTALTDLALYK